MPATSEICPGQKPVNTDFADRANPPPAELVMGGCTLYLGDCREVLRQTRDKSINCCVTSPPYFGLRDYGHPAQIGLEQSPDEYVSQLVSVFREVRRVLRDDGTLWLNLGDTYLNKSLAGIPWRVAFALQQDGWYLRQDIIWHKPNPMPESVRDRCTKAHEYIFLLSKSERYYFDANAIAEPLAESSVKRLSQPTIDQQRGSDRVPGKTNGPMKAVARGGKTAFRGQGHYLGGSGSPIATVEI